LLRNEAGRIGRLKILSCKKSSFSRSHNSVSVYIHGMSKLVFITGATSGFGKACAEIFAANKWNIILNGRRLDRLQEIKIQLENDHAANIFLLPFDVQQKDEVFVAVNSLPEEWQDIDVLVNNAGLALGRDHFDVADMNDWEIMIDTNLKGLLYVSRAVVPFMIKRNAGHVINLGSTAGKEAYENGNVYCASKAAVDSISKGMRIDLLKYQIKVSAIHPGAAETEFSMIRFKGDEEKAAAVYAGYKPLSAKDVADVIFYAANLPAHVCINDLVLTCTAQANSFYTYKG
jgi:3-hydroxy acid dehydrogenase / malonic semialdehyde reductase